MQNKKCFLPTDILIPKELDMTRWSVVACDQYTSQPEYWESVYEFVADAPSTLKMILPEIYLEDGEKRIDKMNETMREYLPLFRLCKNSFIYTERTFADGRIRRGVVGAVDLEQYDYSPGSTSMIRATEGTVLERIPPRVKIRRDAPLELPHIMMLIDNPEKTVIEPLAGKKASFEKLYDFELMQGGGHIAGYLVSGQTAEEILLALDRLSDLDSFNKRYGVNASSPLIYAMGDGNHSLATAKTCYENLKQSIGADNAAKHPARYALSELVNLHDDSLEFEAIHRVVFGCKPEELLEQFQQYCRTNAKPFPAQSMKYSIGGKVYDLTVENPPSPLPAGTLQPFLDEYISKTGAKIDYIHGGDVTVKLSENSGNIGFILPSMPKELLYKSVLEDGALPRKTFSMGEACEKRFYLECRKIK